MEKYEKLYQISSSLNTILYVLSGKFVTLELRLHLEILACKASHEFSGTTLGHPLARQ